MAKGKKTTIKEIKRIDDKIIQINGKEYVIIEDEKDIETAITMKISSHGNRILRFEDTTKKATIDLKRDINIFKYTFTDSHRASRFKKTREKTIVTPSDKIEKMDKAISYINAREIIASYTSKDSPTYDKQSGITTFYVSIEIE
ncbi:MAG: hypothetical protein U9R16_06650 [Campylobacterota bacterium]|nr:hypothetical protein [Campylobacterota bacterium]